MLPVYNKVAHEYCISDQMPLWQEDSFLNSGCHQENYAFQMDKT